MLNWNFLQKVLLAVGFPEQWVGWILNCVLQGTSRVIVNGIAGRTIKLRRGVRQGDPISPYLFILAFDFLARWLKSLVRSGALLLPFANIQPALFYADDSIIFFKPCTQQVHFLKMVLLVFQSISGLALNRTKSDLMITYANDTLVAEMAIAMGCRPATFPIKYLGLSLSDKRLRKSDYFPLIDRIRTKLASWSAGLLSYAGRLVLVNACLTAMPLFFMSAFLVPKWVTKEIDKLRMRFFWHGTSDARKLVMVSWEKICTPKKQGGLGVLSFTEMNKALLARWLWCWISNKDNMWPTLAATLQNNQISMVPEFSPLRGAFLEILPILNIAVIVNPGDGSSILFWHHNWGNGVLKYALADLYSFAIEGNITLLEFRNKLLTNEQVFLEALSTSNSAMQQWYSLQHLLSLQTLSATRTKDNFRFSMNTDGAFSVKTVYKLQKTFPKTDSLLYSVWRLKIPPRMKIFIWQMAQNKIATIDNLKKRGWSLANRCILCAQQEESVKHMFNVCPFFQLTVRKATQHSSLFSSLSFSTNAEFLLDGTGVNVHRELMAILCFIIWRERCSRIFREIQQPINLLVDQIFLEWHSLQGHPISGISFV
ncbi:hypothetical protein LUZ63_014328 [Rhynchospora breviuscula]|uniref:Reverse transcriptase domain-containing protein n=1 Tax=Rhynchospora breviuscula TaxID=2022672 RepID=A0A9Q0CAA4_9POAL|nr:hypothetical protein LUZ63_014328 [Rhynchospora breviuscula]